MSAVILGALGSLVVFFENIVCCEFVAVSEYNGAVVVRTKTAFRETKFK